MYTSSVQWCANNNSQDNLIHCFNRHLLAHQGHCNWWHHVGQLVHACQSNQQHAWYSTFLCLWLEAKSARICTSEPTLPPGPVSLLSKSLWDCLNYCWFSAAVMLCSEGFSCRNTSGGSDGICSKGLYDNLFLSDNTMRFLQISTQAQAPRICDCLEPMCWHQHRDWRVKLSRPKRATKRPHTDHWPALKLLQFV